jgi:hypothetical protein
MRFLVRVMIPTEAGNKSTRDPNFLKNIEDFYERHEGRGSRYFLEMDGRRTALFFVEVQNADMIVPISEPFFQMRADVKFHPVMILDLLAVRLPMPGLLLLLLVVVLHHVPCLLLVFLVQSSSCLSLFKPYNTFIL